MKVLVGMRYFKRLLGHSSFSAGWVLGVLRLFERMRSEQCSDILGGFVSLGVAWGSKHVNLTSMDQERAPTLGVNSQGRLPFTDGRGAYPVLKAIHPGLVR